MEIRRQRRYRGKALWKVIIALLVVASAYQYSPTHASATSSMYIPYYYQEITGDHSFNLDDVIVLDGTTNVRVPPGDLDWYDQTYVDFWNPAHGKGTLLTGSQHTVTFTLNSNQYLARKYMAELKSDTSIKSDVLTLSVLGTLPRKDMMGSTGDDLVNTFTSYPAVFQKRYALHLAQPNATPDQYATAPDIGQFHFGEGVGVDAYVKLERQDTWQYIVGKDDYMYLALNSSNQLTASIMRDGGSAYESAVTTSNAISADGSWHRVQMSYSKSTGQLTVTLDNDTLHMGTSTISGSPRLEANDNPYYLGRKPTGGSYLKGWIDEVRIFGPDQLLVGDWSFNNQNENGESSYGNPLDPAYDDRLTFYGNPLPGYGDGTQGYNLLNEFSGAGTTNNFWWNDVGLIARWVGSGQLPSQTEQEYVDNLFTVWDRILSQRDDNRQAPLHTGEIETEWNSAIHKGQGVYTFYTTSGVPAFKVMGRRDGGTLEGNRYINIDVMAASCLKIESAGSSEYTLTVTRPEPNSTKQPNEETLTISMDPGSPNYIENINGSSDMIAVKDLIHDASAVPETRSYSTCLLPTAFSGVYEDQFMVNGFIEFGKVMKALMASDPTYDTTSYHDKTDSMMGEIRKYAYSKISHNGRLLVDLPMDAVTSGTVKDYSGRRSAGNNGTLIGGSGAAPQLVNGYSKFYGPRQLNEFNSDDSNKGLQFTSANQDYVEIGSSPTTQTIDRNNLYVEAWIKQSQLHGQTIASRTNWWELGINGSGQLRLQANLNGSWTEFDSDINYPINDYNWHFIRIVMNPLDHRIRFFDNGQQIGNVQYSASAYFPADTSGMPMYIGADKHVAGSNPASFFDGIIDNFKYGDANWYEFQDDPQNPNSPVDAYITSPKGSGNSGDGVPGAVNHFAFRGALLLGLSQYYNGNSSQLPEYADFEAAAEKIGRTIKKQLKLSNTAHPDLPDKDSEVMDLSYYPTSGGSADLDAPILSLANSGFSESFMNQYSYNTFFNAADTNKEDLNSGHLNFDMKFINALYDAGVVFDQYDMMDLERTLRDQIADPKLDNKLIKLGKHVSANDSESKFVYSAGAYELNGRAYMQDGMYQIFHNQMEQLGASYSWGILTGLMEYYNRILASDDYEAAAGGQARETWTQVDSSVPWEVTGADGSHWYHPQNTNGYIGFSRVVTGSDASDVSIAAKMKINSLTTGYGNANAAELIVRYQDPSNYYSMGIRKNSNGYVFFINKRAYGSDTPLITPVTMDSMHIPFIQGQTYDVRAVARSNHLSLYVNGQEVLTVDDSTYQSGKYGMVTYYTDALFDDVQVFEN